MAEGLEDYFSTACYNELFDRFMDRVDFDNFDVYEGTRQSRTGYFFSKVRSPKYLFKLLVMQEVHIWNTFFE